jgi:hypothetical protein
VRAATEECDEMPVSLAGKEHRGVTEWSRHTREASRHRGSRYEPVRPDRRVCPDRRGTAVMRAAGHDQACDGNARNGNKTDCCESTATPSSDPSESHPLIVPDHERIGEFPIASVMRSPEIRARRKEWLESCRESAQPFRLKDSEGDLHRTK